MNRCEEIQEIKCAINDLNERLKVLENGENKKWVPEINETYYYVTTDINKVAVTYWEDTRADNLRLQQNRVFKTEREAIEYLEYLEEKRKIYE